MKSRNVLLTAVLILSITINAYFFDQLKPSWLKVNISNFISPVAEEYLDAASMIIPEVSDSLNWHSIAHGVEISNKCMEIEPQKTDYSAQLIDIKKNEEIKAGDVLKVKAYVKNTGNVRWFNEEESCEGKGKIVMQTINPDEHESDYYLEYESSYNGWIEDGSKSKIEMLQDFVDPGEVAVFIFWIKAPLYNDYYREMFSLSHINGEEKDLLNISIPFDLAIGEINEGITEKMKFVEVASKASELNGEKGIDVSLAKQEMYLSLGDKVIKTLPISSGHWKTPTPIGSFPLFLKQKVRVGGQWPHYIMPYFQMFTKYGHGLHALPSLSTDGGVFWTEALNHIQRPVSHGCIRMLPDDAVDVFEFTDLNMMLNIHAE